MQSRPKPLVMGILNVTPNSFSDGGRYYGRGDAFQHAERMVAQGADIIDVGGESTRPGAAPVPVQEEMDRVLPVIEAIVSTLPVMVSVDTRKPEIAKEAVRAGATIVNDVSGGINIGMLDVIRGSKATLILMHMKGTPETMQNTPEYPKGVVPEVRGFLAERVRAFRETGISKDRLWVDPGIGFGKTLEHNLQLLQSLKDFATVGGRLVIGTSRKSFLSEVLNADSSELESRGPGTLTSNLWAYSQGASVFRVHDVEAFRRALATWTAMENAAVR